MRPLVFSRSLAVRVSFALLGLIYLWFLSVTSHRIAEHPTGIVTTFVTGCGDFEHFYNAARAMRDGLDIYTSGMRGYIYPPLISVLFMPLTAFSVQTAAWIMLFVNMALGIVCAWVVCAEVMRRLAMDTSFPRVIVVVALATLLSATKLRSEFQMWQTNILMMTALVFALRFLDARPRLAGLLLGLAFNIKYLPLVFLPYLLLRRRYVAAAWFVIGIVGFALLPATVSGWQTNLGHWATATSGMAHLVGIPTSVAQPANVDPITAGHSLSITSGLSRSMGAHASPSAALAVAAGIALLFAAVLRRVYIGWRQPLTGWPDAAGQADQPYAGIVALEWAAIVTLVLAFSPQTNPRHTSLLLMVFAPLAAMLCFPRPGVSRWPVLAATSILFFGLNLPPNTPQFFDQLTWWRNHGGAGWCMALMLPFFFVAGFQHLAAHSRARAAPHHLVPKILSPASPNPGMM